MAKGISIAERVEALVAPCITELGYRIWDVEYVKEGSDWYLRAYIDKPEGVNIIDCENVSRALSEEMDKADFIADAYILEVSSPGLGRTLKKEKHFMKSMGQEVEVRTYKAIDKCKEFVGILTDYQDGDVTIQMENDVTRTFAKAEVALVRLTFDF